MSSQPCCSKGCKSEKEECDGWRDPRKQEERSEDANTRAQHIGEIDAARTQFSSKEKVPHNKSAEKERDCKDQILENKEYELLRVPENDQRRTLNHF